MKQHFQHFTKRIGLFLLALFPFQSLAQEPFQVKWTMDYTQAGTSSHPNFAPNSALLAGGANTFTLPTVYSTGGAIVAGYIVRPWPVPVSSGRYMEFTFSAGALKYDITSISFRLRRSGDGPNQIRLLTSADAFGSDLFTTAISTTGTFKTYTVPVDFPNLANNTFSARIYAHGAGSIYGVLWFDEIIVSGKVHPIVLPVSLTFLKAQPVEQTIRLSWETTWEKNSFEFVIERSKNTTDFTAIGNVLAAGETVGRKQYHFSDPAPGDGIAYYRLRSVDRDGRSTLSGLVSATCIPPDLPLLISPNPADPRRIIVSGNITGPEDWILTDLRGANIAFSYHKMSEMKLVIMPKQVLQSGIYFLIFPKNIAKEHVRILVP